MRRVRAVRWVRGGGGSLAALLMVMLSVTTLTGAAPAVRAEQSREQKSNLIGVSGNVFPWEPNYAQFQALLDESNAGWSRTEIRFEQVHPAPGRWEWGSSNCSGLRGNEE